MPAAKVLTEKQKKLLTFISENLGSEKPKTMYEMLLAAGYQENAAKQQTTILADIRDKIDPIFEAMTDHREAVLKREGSTSTRPQDDRT
jgi:hypothetical protein